MSNERHLKIRALFDRLVDLPPNARAEVLDAECAGDPELRRDLEDLLAQDSRTESMRVPPIVERLRPAEGETVIGPYRILDRLGEGGFGEVFVAEQSEPIRRRVALKILKAGMDTKSVLARFEAERQALALMDHPSIAKVFDAGETERGRPYFVMELVHGEPITSYADRHRLSLRDRLDLFVSVTNAVQHAHLKGIIHRDLKPSNVLVTLSDDKPLPKIIDFGIAKAMSHSLTEKTLYTEQGLLLGTPEYMSPEQAEMGGLDVDTRTDIYSLGVMLYELLTGSLPFEPQALRNAGIAKIQQMIREEEPPRPSTRVSGHGRASTDAATKRQTDPVRLARQLRGELDWIILKAIEKDRTRRYETANSMGHDIRRYLNDEPVLAGPPSAAYRARKFVKRHRVAIGVVGVVMGSILFALIESNRQRIAAEHARVEAEKARDESEAVTKFLSDMLKSVDPRERGKDISVQQILDEGAKTIEAKFPEQPLIRARLMLTMGNAFLDLGFADRAKPLMEGALALRETTLGAEDPDLAYTLNSLGIMHNRDGDYAGARALYERALAIREKVHGPEHPEVAQVLNNLGNSVWASGDLAGARPLFERSLAIREKTRGPDHPDVAQTLNNLGMLLESSGDYAGARLHLERAIAIREKALGPDHPDVAQSVMNLGVVFYRIGDYAGAVRHYERALAIQEKTLGPDDREVGLSLSNLGGMRILTGDTAGARANLERALAIDEKAHGSDHPDVVGTLVNIAEFEMEVGRFDDARLRLGRALAISERALGPESDLVGQVLASLGRLRAATGDDAGAHQSFERALTIREKALGPDVIEVAAILSGLAELEAKAGRFAQARELREREIRIAEKTLGTNDARLAPALAALADALRALGESTRAESLDARVVALGGTEADRAGK